MRLVRRVANATSYDQYKMCSACRYVSQLTQTPKQFDMDRNIRSALNRTADTREIVSIIDSNMDQIQNASVFAEAMQKCHSNKDWKSVKKLVKLLQATRISPSVEDCNVLLKIMAHSDDPAYASTYFELMRSRYSIQPDIDTFVWLFKSFRKQGQLRRVEQYWHEMRTEYGIDPNECAYAEMLLVYAHCRQKEKCTALFNEYLCKVEQQILKSDEVVFGAHLNMLSLCGDIEGVKTAVRALCGMFGGMNESWVTEVMRTCNVAKQYTACLKVLKRWTQNKQTPTMQQMQLKCIALCQLIRYGENTFEGKYKLYKKLKRTVYSQFARYGLRVHSQIVNTLLQGAVFCFVSKDPQRMVQEFEALCLDFKHFVCYKKYDAVRHQWVIDLHSFQPCQAQFIIRYCFGLRLSEFVSDTDDLLVVVGRGKHSVHRGDDVSTLYKVIVKELSSWQQPIPCRDAYNDHGTLCIHKQDLSEYLKSDNNCAKQKLYDPSQDWYGDS